MLTALQRGGGTNENDIQHVSDMWRTFESFSRE